MYITLSIVWELGISICVGPQSVSGVLHASMDHDMLRVYAWKNQRSKKVVGIFLYIN